MYDKHTEFQEENLEGGREGEEICKHLQYHSLEY